MSPGPYTGLSGPIPRDPASGAVLISSPRDAERVALRRTGVVWESAARNEPNNNATVLTTAKEQLALVYLPQGLVTTGLAFTSGGTSPTAAPTFLWYSLRDSSRNLLQYTVNSTEQWTGGVHPLLWQSGGTYTIPASGAYYLGIAIVQGAGTLPSLIGSAIATTLGGQTPIVAGTTADTIASATPPSTAGALTAITFFPYVEVLG